MTKRKKRILLIIAAVLAAYLLYAYLPLGKQEFVVSPETTYATGPLRPDGTVDYLAYLNAQQAEGVTPENNAAVLLVDALGPDWLCSFNPPDEAKQQAYITEALKLMNHTPAAGPYYVSSDDWAEAQGVDDPLYVWDELPEGAEDPEKATLEGVWTKAEFPAVAAWLADQKGPLDLVVEASRREACFVPLVGDSLLEIQVPALSKLRTVAKSLCRRALLRAGQGDPQGAVEDLLTIHRLARLTAEPFLIHWLVSMASENLASSTAGILIVSDTLDAESARLYARSLSGLPERPTVARITRDGERLFALSYCQNAWRAGKFPEQGLLLADMDGLSTWNLDMTKLMRIANDYYDGLAADMRGEDLAGHPVYRRIDTDDDEDEGLDKFLRLAGHDPPGWFILVVRGLGRPGKSFFTRQVAQHLFTGGSILKRGRMLGNRTRVDGAVALAGMAVCAYQLANGDYPALLGDLVPEYLPAVPDDLYGEGPLKYRREDGGAVVWSIGEDGIDDGGVPQWNVEADYDFRGDRSIRLGSAPRPLRLRVGESATDLRVLATLQYIGDAYEPEELRPNDTLMILLKDLWRLDVTLDDKLTVVGLAVSQMPERPRGPNFRRGPDVPPNTPAIPRKAAQAVTVSTDRDLLSYETPEGEKINITEDD